MTIQADWDPERHPHQQNEGVARLPEDTNCGHTCYAEEPVQAEPVVEPCQLVTKAKVKTKRDVIRFNGEKPIAINLEHVIDMTLDEKKVIFELVSGTAKYVELEDEEAAKNIFESLLNLWSAE